MPRTGYAQVAYDNPLVRSFWGRIKIEKGVALFFYYPHSDSSRLIYALKYGKAYLVGQHLGHLLAEELAEVGFFDDITALVPVPLSKDRLRDRGYNQSEEIAQGIKDVTGLPILKKVVKRQRFNGSLTSLNRWQRNEHIENSFCLLKPEKIAKQHLLLIDDVITSGATLTELAKTLQKAENVRISVASLGFAGRKRTLLYNNV